MNAYRCCDSADEAIILHISIATTRGPVMLFLIVICSNFCFVGPGLRLHGEKTISFVIPHDIFGR